MPSFGSKFSSPAITKANETISKTYRWKMVFWTQCPTHLVALSLSLSQNMHSSFFIPSTYFWSSSNLLSNYRFAFHAFIVKDDKKFSGSKGDIHFYYYIVSISSLFDHDTVMSYVEQARNIKNFNYYFRIRS